VTSVDLFGHGVALNYDGSVLVISSHACNPIEYNSSGDQSYNPYGSYYIYNRINNAWTQTQKVYPSVIGVTYGNGAPNVSINDNGDKITGTDYGGATQVFFKTAQGWFNDNKLVTTAGSSGHTSQVAMARDGTRIFRGMKDLTSSGFGSGGLAASYR
jgi:hypothetical protein